jgi:hypothetical protein
VNGIWFMREGKTFFASLSADQANLVLQSLSVIPRIDHRVEGTLAYIAEQHPRPVWEFFGRRLDRKHDTEDGRFEAFPYHFHGLEQPLGKDAASAIAGVRDDEADRRRAPSAARQPAARNANRGADRRR